VITKLILIISYDLSIFKKVILPGMRVDAKMRSVALLTKGFFDQSLR